VAKFFLYLIDLYIEKSNSNAYLSPFREGNNGILYPCFFCLVLRRRPCLRKPN
jgi:hypothetical protein